MRVVHGLGVSVLSTTYVNYLCMQIHQQQVLIFVSTVSQCRYHQHLLGYSI